MSNITDPTNNFGFHYLCEPLSADVKPTTPKIQPCFFSLSTSGRTKRNTFVLLFFSFSSHSHFHSHLPSSPPLPHLPFHLLFSSFFYPSFSMFLSFSFSLSFSSFFFSLTNICLNVGANSGFRVKVIYASIHIVSPKEILSGALPGLLQRPMK